MEVKVNYRVIYGDTDCGKVIYYANYLRLFEIGRNEFIRALGITYKQIEEKYGIFLPVIESFIKYKAPGFYDDLLTIITKIGELNPYKIKFNCKILRNSKLLVKGYTIHVPVKQGKIVKFPEEVFKILQKAFSKGEK